MHFSFHPVDPGFWIVSTSDDDITELQSYESDEIDDEEDDFENGDEVDSEFEDEIDEEEIDEIDDEEIESEESENDIEVMEILEQIEAQKQNHIEDQLEKVDNNKTENIKNIPIESSKGVQTDNPKSGVIIDNTNNNNGLENKVCR